MKESFKRFIKSYFFFFTVVLTLKFVLLRYWLLYDFNPFASFWFEMSLILIVISMFELILKRGKLVLYIFLDLLLSALFVGMLIYERYFGTIPTYYDLSQLNQVGSVNESMWILFEKTDLVFFVDFLILVVLWFFARKWSYPSIKTSKFTMTGVLVVSLIVTIVNFQMNKDEAVLDNALFAKENGFFQTQFIQYYHENSKSETALAFTGEEQNVTLKRIQELKGNDYVPMKEHEKFGIAKDRNLIVIQIESLQDFVIGKSINGQEITPNINKWLDESLYFSDVYQQIGSGNTSDAEFLMNTSLYPLGNQATTEQIGGMQLPSLPRMLGKRGYHSVTMHADDVTYWNRDELYPALGFDDYYAKEFYGEKDTIGFGPSDGLFYDRSMDALKEISSSHERFYAHVLSLTSHTPFEMPEDKKGLNLPEAYEGTLTGNYMQSVHYADQVLGDFFQDLKESGLWDKSLIALYGDHSGLHGKLLKSEDQDLLKDFIGERYSLLNRFNIPFIVSVPGKKEVSGVVDHIGGQIDMMPTLLNLLGVDPNTIYFGHNLWHYSDNLLGMRYYVPTSSFFNKDTFFIAKNSRFDERILDLTTNNRIEDEFENPSSHFEDERKDTLKLLQWSDAYFESLK